ncbi:Tip elongation aberrant protein 1 [Leucoagaricus sp. SymC.cos]|nr:Tip elongation aberrant protein 1 [Leucoagaricus sp. SymC.cos]
MSELSDLVDLVLSEPQGLSHLSLPSSGLWSHRRPILLPPSPISSEHISGELSPPPFPRYAFGFCATKSGDIYFCGGRGHEYPSLLYYYSTKDNTVTVLDYNGDNPNPRHYHAMAIVGDNILAVHGGKNLFGDHDADPGLFLFNLVSRKWSRIHTSGDAPGSRHGHSMAVIGTTIFMFGGYSIQDSKYFSELWAFDLRTLRTQPRWELVTPLLTERPPPRNVSVFVPYQNQLILFGGWGEQGSTADIWSFNTNTKRWSQLRCMGDIPPPLSYIVGPVLDDVMYVIGGYDGRVGLNDVFALKIPERKWFRLESINKTQNFERRSTHAAVCIGTKIFVFGGCFENGANTSDMIAVFDTKYVNNPDIHMPERLMELEIEFQLKVGEATKENSKVLEFERRLAEVERNKVEMTQENSRLEKRLAEVEEDHKEKKRRDLVAAILKSMSKADSLGSLQGTDAQTMVDFLAEVLESQELFQSDVERRHILHLLRKTAKSAQMFPKRSELRGVRCNLADPINDIGGYGLIYKGIFEGQTVCVKAVRVDAGSGSAAGKIMRAQAGELALLGHVSHPNVIPLYGAFLSAERNPRICIVSPWMENGDLADYLLMFPDTSRIPLMIDVAAGLQFLHGMGVVHADLKARNVLVSHSQRALLADFGVSAIVNTVVGTSTAGDISGTTYWMAPELLVAEESPMPPTQQSDMWGYGCICFEMKVLTGLPPFIEHYKYPIQLVGAFMRGGVTPLQPKRNGPPIVVDGGPLMTLAERCWNYEPSKRPTAAEAMQLLAELNVEDNRPSMDEELAIFEVVRSKRVKVEIDYRRLLSVVRKVSFGRSVGGTLAYE